MGGCITSAHKKERIPFCAVDYEKEDFDVRNLPWHIWVDIFSGLDIVSQQRVRRVCALWNHFISSPPLSSRHSVRFELNPRTYQKPRQSDFTGAAINPRPRDGFLGFNWLPRRRNTPSRASATTSAIDRIFAASLRPETKEIIFSHSSESDDLYIPCVKRSLLLQSLYDFPDESKSRPVALQRLIFANLALTNPMEDYPWPPYQTSVPEVILRNVTLLAKLSITPTQIYVMRVSGISKRCSTAEETDFLMRSGFAGCDGRIKWAKFVSELAGPLSSSEEEVTVDWLGQAGVHRFLAEELANTDVWRTLDKRFHHDVGNRDFKEYRNWFRGLDLWTQRFLYHYLYDNVVLRCSAIDMV